MKSLIILAALFFVSANTFASLRLYGFEHYVFCERADGGEAPLIKISPESLSATTNTDLVLNDGSNIGWGSIRFDVNSYQNNGKQLIIGPVNLALDLDPLRTVQFVEVEFDFTNSDLMTWLEEYTDFLDEGKDVLEYECLIREYPFF